MMAAVVHRSIAVCLVCEAALHDRDLLNNAEMVENAHAVDQKREAHHSQYRRRDVELDIGLDPAKAFILECGHGRDNIEGPNARDRDAFKYSHGHGFGAWRRVPDQTNPVGQR